MKKSSRKYSLRQGPATRSQPARSQPQALPPVEPVVSIHIDEVREKAQLIRAGLTAAEAELASIRALLGDIV